LIRRLVLLAVVCATMMACGAPPQSSGTTAKVTSPPTPAGSPQVATPTAMLSVLAPTPSPAPSPSPAAASSPDTSAPAASPVASPPVAASPAAVLVTPLPNGQLFGPTYRVVAERSEARYIAREKLVSQPAPSEAIGRTRAIEGEIQTENDGVLRGQVVSMRIDLRTLTSDRPERDSFIRQTTLQTDQYPYATFRSTDTAGVALARPGEEATFHIGGLMTIRGRDVPVVWEARARLEGSAIVGTASAKVRLTEFGLEPPRLAVLSVEDEMTWQIDLVAERAS
jgi:polyisoprenoid-binding protein YceI